MPVFVFSLVLVFRRKGISNGVQMEWNLRESYFLTEAIQETWSRRHRSFEVATRQGGMAPHPHGPLVAPLTDFFRLYMSIYPKNIGEQNRSGVSPPEASVATENQSRPILAPCWRGNHLRWPSSSSGSHHDEEGVVHPRGWGFVPVVMCFISLSHDLYHGLC